MDRPSSVTVRSRAASRGRIPMAGRSVVRIAALALALAFAHVWESVTVAELHTRLDKERTHHEQLTSRLHQLTSQLAQIRGRAEASAGGSALLGFVTPSDGQVKLVSAGLLGGPARRIATHAAPSLWDWVAGAASAETRGPADDASGDEVLP